MSSAYPVKDLVECQTKQEHPCDRFLQRGIPKSFTDANDCRWNACDFTSKSSAERPRTHRLELPLITLTSCHVCVFKLINLILMAEKLFVKLLLDWCRLLLESPSLGIITNWTQMKEVDYSKMHQPIRIGRDRSLFSINYSYYLKTKKQINLSLHLSKGEIRKKSINFLFLLILVHNFLQDLKAIEKCSSYLDWWWRWLDCLRNRRYIRWASLANWSLLLWIHPLHSPLNEVVWDVAKVLPKNKELTM